VTLGERSSLGMVAAAVAAGLRDHGIQAVLTGGACASLYSDGAYHSRDLDFVVIGGTTQALMDAAMAVSGFARRGDRYVHPRARFYVEFPRGPLAIGGEHRIRPVMRATAHGRIRMLSATDSCRDRLAAFYHWGDRQSLTVAAWIAGRNRVGMAALQRWSVAEGAADRFQEFVAEKKRIQRRSAMVRRPRRARKV
jgi:hypothetical protein